MNGNVHQTAFAARFDIGNDIYGIQVQFAAGNCSNTAAAFREEHVTIWKPCERPRDFEAIRDGLYAKPDLSFGSAEWFALVDSGRRRTAAAKPANYNKKCNVPDTVQHRLSPV